MPTTPPKRLDSSALDATCPAHAADDHPRVPKQKIGVLLANLGTPDGTDYWSMRRYLSEFLSDKRVIDYPAWKWQPILQGIILSIRPQKSGKAYASIWNNEANESPLATITKDQTAALSTKLNAAYGGKVMVDYCMRYGNPSTKSKVRKMVEQGCTKILFFPLYPQYAGATIATANDAFFRALMDESWQPAARTVAPYFDDAQYIDALAQSVEQAYAKTADKPDILVCSYHGLPERYLLENGDPYHCQCHKTTRLLKERLGWDNSQIITTFQSKFGPEDWLQPYTVEEVARQAQAGNKKIAVIAPAFSADCIETLEEINEEIRESFEHAGGTQFTYVPCLNDTPAHIDALARIIDDNLRGWI
ncbi:Ferrochelatase [Aquimixticola soesokkakensis]|uniref:Ferrochelatase n=1 Tax=Aquimixticola soesokkakensis TaxID=1519096 RepID=A0A1Y5R7N0_9RHOB|nr:ferrochelatase [Aquimixticola soesokkakensis]SLN11046.1 Ferrochelatase [Aquimixticola soesokkakensis]